MRRSFFHGRISFPFKDSIKLNALYSERLIAFALITNSLDPFNFFSFFFFFFSFFFFFFSFFFFSFFFFSFFFFFFFFFSFFPFFVPFFLFFLFSSSTLVVLLYFPHSSISSSLRTSLIVLIVCVVTHPRLTSLWATGFPSQW